MILGEINAGEASSLPACPVAVEASATAVPATDITMTAATAISCPSNLLAKAPIASSHTISTVSGASVHPGDNRGEAVVPKGRSAEPTASQERYVPFLADWINDRRRT